jgi:hypothetical protein
VRQNKSAENEKEINGKIALEENAGRRSARPGERRMAQSDGEGGDAAKAVERYESSAAILHGLLAWRRRKFRPARPSGNLRHRVSS